MINTQAIEKDLDDVENRGAEKKTKTARDNHVADVQAKSTAMLAKRVKQFAKAKKLTDAQQIADALMFVDVEAGESRAPIAEVLEGIPYAANVLSAEEIESLLNN